MRKTFFVIPLLLCLHSVAQHVNPLVPPSIQWQRCYGGRWADGTSTSGESMKATTDGGYIVCGGTGSSDGDVTGQYGEGDAWIIKFDVAGNIQWQKNYGGSHADMANTILHTTDGGYIFVGETFSNDIDVSGNHSIFSDVWVVKISATGVVEWQKCYGGSARENGAYILPTPDGGYIIGATTASSDGDVTGWHPGTPNPLLPPDVWMVKIDGVGNIQWQKCYGGTRQDDLRALITTSDGGYLFNGRTESTDGDVACTAPLNNVWTVKLDNSGNIQWQKCFGAAWATLIQTPDGGYCMVTATFFTPLPEYHGGGDIYIIKLDAFGNIQWQKLYGGTGLDAAVDAYRSSDGGYVIAGYSTSADGDVCGNKGQEDVWVLKVDGAGNKEWQRTFGGSRKDTPSNILPGNDGGLIVAVNTLSNDFDLTGNHQESFNDIALVKLDFPGTPLLPAVSIASDKTTICPGEPVRFIATPVEGGTTPFYQWQVNGVNAGTNNDTIYLNTLNDGDIVRCQLTSSSPCVTSPNASSNTITINVDPSLKPVNFLPIDTAVCNLGNIVLKASGTYATYTWNTGATTPTVVVTQPGKYWLDVTTSTGCPGSDTVNVAPKECLRGVFTPTGFTPNNDGKNDLLKPIVAGTILKYQFTIMNRWGEIVFQTTDTQKGWDGRFKGLEQNGGVFVWTCSYQLAGETARLKKGTFVLIR